MEKIIINMENYNKECKSETKRQTFGNKKNIPVRGKQMYAFSSRARERTFQSKFVNNKESGNNEEISL